MVKLIEVVKHLGDYKLREVFVNPKHVISLREDASMLSRLGTRPLSNLN